MFFIFVLICTTTIDNDDTNANTETFERQIQLQCEIISTRTPLWLQKFDCKYNGLGGIVVINIWTNISI